MESDKEFVEYLESKMIEVHAQLDAVERELEYYSNEEDIPVYLKAMYREIIDKADILGDIAAKYIELTDAPPDVLDNYKR